MLFATARYEQPTSNPLPDTVVTSNGVWSAQLAVNALCSDGNQEA